MAQLPFDATHVPPQTGQDPIPDGVYHARITESEIKPTKTQDGQFLALTLEIMDGAYAGRKLFDRLNIANPNPQATEIAQKRLSAYCHATGVYQIQDSQQLHNIPIKVKVVTVTDASGKYEPSNEIRRIAHVNDTALGGTAAAPGQMAGAALGMPVPQAPAPMYPPPAQYPQQGYTPPPAPTPGAWNPMGQPTPQGFSQAPPQGFPQQPTAAPVQTPPAWAPPTQPQPQPQPQAPVMQAPQAPPQASPQPAPQGWAPPPGAPPVGPKPPWVK